MSFNINSLQDIRLAIAARAKGRRLDLNLSQVGLAGRSGVSTGSLKRFEKTGRVSLESLLKIALVLEALDEFGTLFQTRVQAPASLEELMKTRRTRRRGRIR